MSRFRKNLLTAVTFVVFAAMAFAMTSLREIYPFAPYTMYAKLHDLEELKIVKVYFVDAEGKQLEIKNEYIYPFDESRLIYGFWTLRKGDENWQYKMEQQLAEVFAISQKESNKSALPGERTFVGMEVYETAWNDLNSLRTGIPSEKILWASYEK